MFDSRAPRATGHTLTPGASVSRQPGRLVSPGFRPTPPCRDATGTTTSGGSSGDGTSGGSGSSGSASGGSDSDTAGDKSGYGQSCGSNDIDWAVETKEQAGGHFLITAKAKSGITCVLPAGLPAVQFGSNGPVAKNAEQSAGAEITLTSGVTIYAGVDPKSVEKSSAEYTTMVVSVADDDPHPVDFRIDSTEISAPIVTDWHTSAGEAVPYAG